MQYKLETPVHAEIGETKYACTVQWRNGSFVSDEPVKTGGKDLGPDPFTLFLSSVASCTLITLRMYIDRKGWDIPHITVEANLYQQKKGDTTVTVIDRDIKYGNTIPAEQRDRLNEIAQACPITKMLQGEMTVRTFTYNDSNETKQMQYSNGEITVLWKPDICKHSARCVTQLPSVFNVNKHPWINMQGATSEDIIRQVGKCPTGALSIQQKDL